MQRVDQFPHQQRGPLANNYNSNHNDYTDLGYNKQQKIQDLEVLNKEIFHTLAFNNVDSLNYANHTADNHFANSHTNSNNYNNNNNINSNNNSHQFHSAPEYNSNNTRQVAAPPLKKSLHTQPKLASNKNTPPLAKHKPKREAPNAHTNTNTKPRQPAPTLANRAVGGASNPPTNANHRQFEPVSQRHLAASNPQLNINADFDAQFYQQDYYNINNPHATNKSDILSIDSYASTNPTSTYKNANDYSHVGSKINTNLKSKSQNQGAQPAAQVPPLVPLVPPIAYPLFEKNMKTKNNQSSFAKNPSHSYAEQFYASLPPGFPPLKPGQKVPPLPPAAYYPPFAYPPQYAAAMAAAAAAYQYPPGAYAGGHGPYPYPK